MAKAIIQSNLVHYQIVHPAECIDLPTYTVSSGHHYESSEPLLFGTFLASFCITESVSHIINNLISHLETQAVGWNQGLTYWVMGISLNLSIFKYLRCLRVFFERALQ